MDSNILSARHYSSAMKKAISRYMESSDFDMIPLSLEAFKCEDGVEKVGT
jgi:hypothetical protein